MKITKIFKLQLFASLMLCLNFSDVNGKNPIYIFHDTIIRCNDYTIEIKDTYIRPNAFLRTTLIITNPGDQFLIFNPQEIFLTTQALNKLPSRYEKPIVIPPHYSKKINIKFSEVDFMSQFVEFNFSGIATTSNPEVYTINENLLITNDNGYKISNIVVEIIDSKLLPEELMVRIRVKHVGNKFLGIDFNNIGLIIEGSAPCYNLKKGLGKFHFEPYREEEVYKLLFSRKCVNVDDRKKSLSFNTVFTEYSYTAISGTKIKLRALGPTESLKEKENKKEIETID